ncbi:LysM peptidoglycan-binding domain-containing protein, partial [Sphingomonas elodea]|uniref:LysM peptidoglycan-binding domain-containing protein n=1 Tax=Sphingomonas elodea TaxID=179878 RepID=UPI0002631069
TTTGMGTFGGWVKTTSYANGRTSVENSDMFGHVTYTADLGGPTANFAYDLAGRQVLRWGRGPTIATNYLNTGLVGSIVSTTGDPASAPNNVGQSYQVDRTSFRYDANGNRVREVYTRDSGQWVDNGYYNDQDYWGGGYWVSDWQWQTASTTFRDASASYDALNRMTGWNEWGNPTTPAAHVTWSYDAMGNVRRVTSDFAMLDQNGGIAYRTGQDYWYAYDAMNRVILAKGQLINGQIVRGAKGTDYSYYLDGRRATATVTTTGYATVWDPNVYVPGNGGGGYYEYPEPDNGSWGAYVTAIYDAARRENYTYDADGNLATVSIAQSGYSDNGDGTASPLPLGYAQLKSRYEYDGQGRMTRQIDFQWDGNSNGTAAYDRQITLDVGGRVTSETVVTRQGNDTITSYLSNDYGWGSNYALGAVVNAYATTYKNGSYQYSSTTSTNYIWYAGAVASSVSYSQTGQSTKTSNYYYDGWGNLASVTVGDGRPRNIRFTNDMFGQVIRRDESDNNGAQGDPHEIWYRFGGKQIGYNGNNGTTSVDYQASIDARTQTQGTGAFRGGATWGAATADFDQSGVDPINSYAQGSAGGGYVVRAGETLQSIAQSVWGDANLWYKIAQANGLSGPAGLTEGQRLNLPAGVQRATFNAATLNPYDPAKTLGDTNPTTPTPQAPSRRGGCGVFGQILLIAVAVAVTIASAGSLTAALGPVAGGAAAGAAGSIASQTFGLATGIQDSFSWSGVALSAIAGGVGAGLGQVGGTAGKFLKADTFLSNAVRGAVGSAITQGIGVATGLQSKFDWVGVAAAGIGAGAGGAFARNVLGVSGGQFANGMAGYAQQAATSAADALANAATRTLLEGSDFGDNIMAALPSVIGNTIG